VIARLQAWVARVKADYGLARSLAYTRWEAVKAAIRGR
jgi:hypothetical protein